MSTIQKLIIEIPNLDEETDEQIAEELFEETVVGVVKDFDSKIEEIKEVIEEVIQEVIQEVVEEIKVEEPIIIEEEIKELVEEIKELVEEIKVVEEVIEEIKVQEPIIVEVKEIKEELKEDIEEIKKTFIELLSEYINTIDDLDIEIKNIFLSMINNHPEYFNNFEKIMNIIISNKKVNNNNIPNFILLIEHLYEILYILKIKKEKLVNLTGIILKFLINCIILERKIENIELLEHLNTLIDSCINLISLSKVVKKNINDTQNKGCSIS